MDNESHPWCITGAKSDFYKRSFFKRIPGGRKQFTNQFRASTVHQMSKSDNSHGVWMWVINGGSTHGSRQRDGFMNRKHKCVFAETKCVYLIPTSTYIHAIFIHPPYLILKWSVSLLRKKTPQKIGVRSKEPTFCGFLCACQSSA